MESYGGNDFVGGAGNTTMMGSGNSAFGSSALRSNLFGNSNTAVGNGALSSNDLGSNNAAFGMNALEINGAGEGNAAFGMLALSTSHGNNNAAFGTTSLQAVDMGNYNIAVGYGAGLALQSGDYNIYIGNIGVSHESRTVRIGDYQTATYIAGINGATVGSGVPVYVGSDGRLGTVTSSACFKNDIADMGGESDVLMRLRPVAFYYKPELDETHTRQYGLVAEEVAELAPGLVVYDKDGAPQTVRYHFVNAMLLNEVQKQRLLLETERDLVEEQRNTIENLQARLERLEAALARKH